MFRFAIMGAGNIAGKFCQAVAQVKECTVAAVASKSPERARSFAERNGIQRAYGDYEEMLLREKPDAVYIAVVPCDHYRLTMLCLKYQTPVLCEKAMFVSEKDAADAFAESEKQGVFVMEALWSRFLPANRKAREWLSDGRIGAPKFLNAAIGFHAPSDLTNRYHSAALGGGASTDITVYAYELATWFLPGQITQETIVAQPDVTGVDLSSVITLKIGECIAVLTTTFASEVEEKLSLWGDQGMIIIPHPHYASEALLYDEAGNLLEHFTDESGRAGFTWEIEEVIRCVQNGVIESSIVPHRTTQDCAALFDRISESLKV